MIADRAEPLRGRRALVVGGSTGIGRAIAQAWSDAGAQVVVCSRTEPRDVAWEWCQVDLADPGQARERLNRLGSGRLDMVCFSAVHYGERRARFCDTAEAEWRHQLEVNVTGLWLTLAATLPALRAAAPGLMVGVSSEVAFNAGPERSGYAATKAAAKALLDSLAQEEDPAEVRIVQVLPAEMVDTPGIRRRRAPGFDYGSYMRPAAFARLAVALSTAPGPEYHGESLVVGEDGTWWPAHARTPRSQSRPTPQPTPRSAPTPSRPTPPSRRGRS
uniref:PrlW n=1 Tax=Nonomuraea spiralis TaxID=46182 RepID=L7SWR3_9ACTN|nr:PrlW [Nonomuraea spiralis]